MKRIMKWLYAGFLKIAESVVSILSVLLFSSCGVNKSFKRLKLRICDKDECYILANGPSLKTFLEKGEYPKKNVFVVNMFALSSSFRMLKPDNYIIADPLMSGRKKDYSSTVEQVYSVINGIDWEMNMFFPNNVTKEIVQIVSGNPKVKVIKYNITPVNGFRRINHFMFRHNLGMPLAQNVTNAAVFCALNCGFKKIYLYGAEHSWMKSFDCDPRTHKLFMNDGHFYEVKNMRYFQRGEYCDWLLYIHKAMKSHFALREYADSIGSKVINKTEMSFIEAYEFDEY